MFMLPDDRTGKRTEMGRERGERGESRNAGAYGDTQTRRDRRTDGLAG